MFEKIKDNFPEAIYYGFANGDIMFDSGLERTLSFMLSADNNALPDQVIVGRRINVKVCSLKSITVISCIYNKCSYFSNLYICTPQLIYEISDDILDIDEIKQYSIISNK